MAMRHFNPNVGRSPTGSRNARTRRDPICAPHAQPFTTIVGPWRQRAAKEALASLISAFVPGLAKPCGHHIRLQAAGIFDRRDWSCTLFIPLQRARNAVSAEFLPWVGVWDSGFLPVCTRVTSAPLLCRGCIGWGV